LLLLLLLLLGLLNAMRFPQVRFVTSDKYAPENIGFNPYPANVENMVNS
jgi:hypothetical protein